MGRQWSGTAAAAFSLGGQEIDVRLDAEVRVQKRLSQNVACGEPYLQHLFVAPPYPTLPPVVRCDHFCSLDNFRTAHFLLRPTLGAG